jgi:hypothetical protein
MRTGPSCRVPQTANRHQQQQRRRWRMIPSVSVVSSMPTIRLPPSVRCSGFVMPSIRDPHGIAPPSRQVRPRSSLSTIRASFFAIRCPSSTPACGRSAFSGPTRVCARPTPRRRAASRSPQSDPPFVALHIRRGDSAKEKGAWIPLRTFWNAAKRVVAASRLGRRRPKSARRCTSPPTPRKWSNVFRYLTANESALYRVVFDDEQVRFSLSGRFEIDRQVALIDSAIARNARSKHAFEFLTDIMAFERAAAFVGTLGSNVGGIVAELRNGTQCTFLDIERDREKLHVNDVPLDVTFRAYAAQGGGASRRRRDSRWRHWDIFGRRCTASGQDDKQYGVNKVLWFRQALFPTHGQDAVAFNCAVDGQGAGIDRALIWSLIWSEKRHQRISCSRTMTGAVASCKRWSKRHCVDELLNDTTASGKFKWTKLGSLRCTLRPHMATTKWCRLCSTTRRRRQCREVAAHQCCCRVFCSRRQLDRHAFRWTTDNEFRGDRFGACKECECTEYWRPPDSDRVRCDACDCAPLKHVKLTESVRANICNFGINWHY